MKILLASASPRRKELLEKIGWSFVSMSSAVDEQSEETEPIALVETLAQQKADFFRQSHPDFLIIGADTVVAIDGKILGKPTDQEEARAMLEQLSGRWHQVYTGVCLLYKGKRRTFHEQTEVKMYALTTKEKEDYLATGESQGKAGAYAIQGKGALLVEKIKGDYYNVVGLPIAGLAREVEALKKEDDPLSHF